MSQDDEKLLTPETSLLDIDDADDLFVKPVKKHKILMLSDHQLAPSGVGVQSRFLIEKLVATGRYTFRCLGGAIKHNSYDTISVNPDFLVKPVDGFGTKELIRELLITERPDALLLFTDPRQFIWLWEMEDEIHQICPITYWHVWDNDPYPKFNAPWYQSCELINCLSKKTFDMVKPNFPEKTNYIPHAFPKEVFFPIPQEQADQLNAQNFGERASWFKCLWVNRNAVRKMPADLLVSWKLFLEKMEAKHGHKNAMLIMHTDPKDREGPDLLAVAEELDLHDNVWFSTDKLDFPQMNILHNLTDTVVNIAKNEGFGLCVSPNTLVNTDLGHKFIKDVDIGDLVKSSDGKFHKVLATSSREEKNLIDIKAHGNPKITSSHEHPFLVFNEENKTKSWRTASELAKGDLLCYPKLSPIEGKKPTKKLDLYADWIGDKEKVILSNKTKNNAVMELKMGYTGIATNGLTISDIQKEFGVTKHYAECVRSVGLGIHTSRKHNLKAIKALIQNYEIKTGKPVKFNDSKQKINRHVNVDEELFNFLGWYLAEGSNNAGKGIELDFHAKEFSIAKRLQGYVNEAFGLTHSGVVEKYDNKSRFYCSSTILSEFLEKACGKYSQNKRLHPKLFDIARENPSFEAALLRGIFFGDGHFGKKTRIVALTTTSSLMANQVRDLLLSRNIMCSLRRRKTKCQDAYSLRVFGEDYVKFCKLISVDFVKTKNKTQKRHHFDEEFAYFPIRKIRRFKETRELYDIQVEDAKDFIANGIVAHNSTLISMQCGKPVVALATGGETSKVIDPEDGSEHGVAIQPTVRTLVGSQQVPYIYEDIASHEDTANALLKVHDMTLGEKVAMKEKVLNYVDRAFNFDQIVKDWDESLDSTITAFKAKKQSKGSSWSLTTLNPVVSAGDVEIPGAEKQKEKPVKRKKAVRKKKQKKATAVAK